MKNYLIIFSLSMPLFIAGCASSTLTPNSNKLAQNQSLFNSGNYQYNKTSTTYSNSAIQLSITLPNTWKTLTQRGFQELAQNDQLVILQDSKNNQLVANYLEKELQENKVRLFFAYQPVAGTDYNKITSISTRRRSVFDATNTADLRTQLIYSAKQAKPEKNTSINFNFPLERIAGQAFVHYETISYDNKIPYYNEVYIRPLADYNLHIVIAFPGKRDNQLIQSVLSNIHSTNVNN